MYIHCDTHAHSSIYLHVCIQALVHYIVSTDDNEQFLVISEAKAKDTETLKTSLELLETSQAIVPLLDRNAQVILSLHTHTHARTHTRTHTHIHTHTHVHTTQHRVKSKLLLIYGILLRVILCM